MHINVFIQLICMIVLLHIQLKLLKRNKIVEFMTVGFDWLKEKFLSLYLSK